MMRRNSDQIKDHRIERPSIRAAGFGRNYFYALTEHLDNDTSADVNVPLNSDPPWQDELPLSVACTVQSTVLVTQQGQVYQTGTLHGRVYPTWVHIEIPMPLRCVEVAAGRHFCLARMEGGKAVLAWGAGHFGQLGVVTSATHRTYDDSGSVSSNGSSGRSRNNHNGGKSSAPTAKCITFTTQPILIERLLPVFTGSPIQTIAAGDWHGLAVTESGQVWAWGSNQSLQCGIQLSSKDSAGNLMGTIALPLPISGIPPMKQVAAGRSHSCALTADHGKVYCWGNSSAGQCGTGVTSRRSVKGLPPSPVQGVPSSLEMIQIAASGNHCISLSKAGRVFTWGDGREGQLGISISTSTSKCVSLQDHQSNKPRLVADLDFVAVAASFDFPAQPVSCAHGENSSEGAASAAAALALVPRIVSVHAADNSSAAVSSSGHLYCWGSNDVGHLGLPKPDHICREIVTMVPSENHIETQPPLQNFYRGRDLNIESFDSTHNIVLPTRVKAVDALFVTMIAFGSNHMMCFGTGREQEDSSVIVGRTLHEAQYDQLRSQQTDLLLTTKPYIETAPAHKMEHENTAPCPAEFLQASNLDTDESKVVHESSMVNGESADLIVSAKAASDGVLLDEVTQSIGNTSLSSTNTTAAATTIEGENLSSLRECIQVESVQPILEPKAETRKNETKRQGAIRRLSNRLLRRRQPHGKK
jgi:alpha-tubulin suppressor-like RCC1 family protein